MIPLSFQSRVFYSSVLTRDPINSHLSTFPSVHLHVLQKTQPLSADRRFQLLQRFLHRRPRACDIDSFKALAVRSEHRAAVQPQMCLVHDLGEAVTGDIPAFVKTENNERDEAQALHAVVGKLPEPHRSELAALFAEMDAQASEEARLYKALDKIEAVIQHNEADIATWLPLEYDLQLTYGVSECAHMPYMKALRETVADDTRRKIEESRQG